MLVSGIVVSLAGVRRCLDEVPFAIELRKDAVPLVIQTSLVSGAGGNGRSASHSLGGVCEGVKEQRLVLGREKGLLPIH